MWIKQRKLKLQSLADLAYEDDDGEKMYPDALLADNSNPESEFERAWFMEEFFAALNELPKKQRDVFIWNELEDMALQEIADKSGESIKTIISRKRYAVAILPEGNWDMILGNYIR